jgi:hypothetical protein
MDSNRITINFEEKDEMMNEINNQQQHLTELYNNKIIDSDTYYGLLDETCDELYAEEEEDYEYEYIYKCDIVGMGHSKKLYYKEAVDTHWLFDLDLSIGKILISYIRVSKKSPEYSSAFYNTKTNNLIKIPKKKDNMKNSIFFSSKHNEI